jgi:uncharacterized protein
MKNMETLILKIFQMINLFKKLNFVFLLTAFFFLSCKPTKKEEVIIIDTVAHKTEIEQWQAKRINDLKAPNGWLNLIGLHWLHDGINTFGSGKNNDIVFPEGKIADKAGYLVLKQNKVTLEIAPKVNITVEGKPVKSLTVFNPDSTRQPVVEFDSLRWTIIKRDDQFGVRLRDLNNADLKNFKGIERYPVDVKWKLKAKWEKADSTKTIDITNVLGQTTAQKSPGTFVFEIDGKEFRLDALMGNKEEYFIIFADSTTGKETYGAGRFIYVKHPDENGKAFIDFNKAYNPPCAFTPYATCPLPPKQNMLDIAVTSGEKNYGDYSQLKHSVTHE